MSLKILGYTPDGHRIVLDEGRNMARVSGYGGSLIHHVLTVTKPAPKRLPRQPLNRQHALCGFVMRMGTPCARGPHKDKHHRAEVVA